MKNILIVDDHKLIYEGLVLHLDNMLKGYNFLYAENKKQAIETVKRKVISIVILDVSLKNETGFDIALEIKDRVDYIFFLSMHKQACYIKRAHELYNGYFLKDSSADIIAEAIRNPGKKPFWAEEEVNEIAEYLISSSSSESELYNKLSHREQEIFLLLAEGLNYKAISKKLFISPKTASAHRYNIMQKLSLKDQTELIKIAVSLGLISL